jgi:hypothetical protein
MLIIYYLGTSLSVLLRSFLVQLFGQFTQRSFAFNSVAVTWAIHSALFCVNFCNFHTEARAEGSDSDTDNDNCSDGDIDSKNTKIFFE